MAELETVQEPHKLDEVMLAMDVVDTLRHEQQMLAKDLSAGEREEQLIKRLREIYDAQGIDVPDRILREGVKAMDDHRFVYEAHKGGFISKAYINRGRWGKPLLIFVGMIGMAWGINYAAFEMPRQAKLAQTERALTVEIPNALASTKDKALAIAKTGDLKEKIKALYENGMSAAKQGNAKEARRIKAKLQTLSIDISKAYTVRIVSRPGENSGVFRVHDNNASVRNYYLIVEAIDASGKRQDVTIASEEDQKTKRTNIWGVRVPKSIFNRVAADKGDDQIIQKAVIGSKKRGFLDPVYNIKTLGGLIVEW
ncbi:MAG: DUF6384 family protein [Robiginitomaculum sp.]